MLGLSGRGAGYNSGEAVVVAFGPFMWCNLHAIESRHLKSPGAAEYFPVEEILSLL